MSYCLGRIDQISHELFSRMRTGAHRMIASGPAEADVKRAGQRVETATGAGYRQVLEPPAATSVSMAPSATVPPAPESWFRRADPLASSGSRQPLTRLPGRTVEFFRDSVTVKARSLAVVSRYR